MRVKIADCLGICNGVRRALDIVEQALDACENNILYVYNEIVHNTFVINELKKRNVIFVHSVDEIPDGAFVVFSAHGVSRDVEAAAKEKNLRVFDATCLLVKKNHRAVEQAFAEKKRIIFIGKRTHTECVGTIGRVADGYCYVVENEKDVDLLPDFDDEVIVVTQTTLAMCDVENISSLLDRKYKNIKHLGGICFATYDRQNAIIKLAKECDLILVAGSAASSNSCRLVQIAEKCGINAQLIDSVDDVKNIDFSSYQCVGITAGASTPQEKIDELITFVQGI